MDTEKRSRAGSVPAGYFNPGTRAGYTIQSLNLPVPWEFILANPALLLKVDQFGPVYAQAEPPSGILLFKRERTEKFSPWITWIRSSSFAEGAFCNFFRPNLMRGNPSAEPDKLSVAFAPESAVYSFEREGLSVRTEITVPLQEPDILMRIEVMNLRKEKMEFELIPALAPYSNPVSLAPWDKPEWYLRTGAALDGSLVFWTRLFNMNSEKGKRRAIVFRTDSKDLDSIETSWEKFTGSGDFSRPEAVFAEGLRLRPGKGGASDATVEGSDIFGYPPIFAVLRRVRLEPGRSITSTQILSVVPFVEGHGFPDSNRARAGAGYFRSTLFDEKKAETREAMNAFLSLRRIDTPDSGLDYYVNDWLALQMHWAAALDRGWPSGMRGSRDSANDFTAMVPLDPVRSAEILRILFSCQRSDGWFPRQYSAEGRKSKHDLRGHVDAGAWVLELLYEYLCHTKDFSVLAESLPWLDDESESTVRAHAERALDYYLRPENLGEHGLCKIGEGDWLDSVNRAGLRGRGESVTVTNQVLIALTYMAQIFPSLAPRCGILKADFTENIRTHAYNREGYFNGVFNDEGHWLFSDRDPDGRKRVYGPANWYSIASGAASPEMARSAIAQLDFLRCEMGYRLYWPPMGDIPIEGVGRSGSGDMPPGLWENGNVYNQGSHGFLGRALAVLGEGDLLYEVLRLLLPYDQTLHPTSKTLTPPYAMVNCWQQVPGFEHRGGLCFLTGSTALGLRMCYDWMFGIKPTLEGLSIDPCVPSRFKALRASFPYGGKRIELEIRNEVGRQCSPSAVTLNGKPATKTRADPFSGRRVHVLDDSGFSESGNSILVTM